MRVMTARLTFETHTALLLAMADIERLQAGTSDPEVLALIERGKYDIAAGWHEAAHDALGRARKLLQTHTEGSSR